MDIKSRVSQALRDCHLKVTKHRIDIMELLIKAASPLSADAIFQSLTANHQSIDLSTVYRILETLEEKRLVIKVVFENDTKTLYEFNHQIHHHFLICLNCNQIMTVKSCPIEAYEEHVSIQNNFQVVGHKLEFYGYCEACQKKGNSESEPEIGSTENPKRA